MLKKVTPPSKFSGNINVPPDKSLTHRAIFFSSLAKGVSTIENPLLSEDCLSTASCMEALGVPIERLAGKWVIKGLGLWGFKPPKGNLNCGNSGTTMRLMSGILSAQNFTCKLEGDVSLSKRPMNRVAEPLSKMGATFHLQGGKYAPFELTGTKNIQPIHWINPVASAQVKSAVLLAALHAKGQTIYEEPTLSRDHTERMLQACGVKLERKNATVILHGPAELTPQTWRIPGDISSAAFFLIAGLLVPGANVTLNNVNTNPSRTGILDVLKKAGAKITLANERTVGGEPVADLIVNVQTELNPLIVDAAVAPRLIDEIPVLAVAATQCKGISKFSGLEELRVKETDRLNAIAKNLIAMGARVEEKPDGLLIHGPTQLRGADLESFEDHRIAMAFAVAGLLAQGETKIHGSECVSISYPTFWDDLQKLCNG